MRPSLRILLLLVCLLPVACGSGGSSGSGTPSPVDDCIVGDGPEVSVTGTVTYQRLVLSSGGLGPALELRPARYVDVQVRIVGGGTCYGTGSTDASGDFTLFVRPPAGSTLEVWAFSRTNQDAERRVTVHDALPPSSNSHMDSNLFTWTSASFSAGSATPVVLEIPYNRSSTSSRPSIGFGTLDVLVTCSEAIRLATGSAPPLCHAYTRLGNNGATGTSFYSDTSRALTLLGGASGNLDGSDTDYFDDGVIAHEYHHFIEYHLAHTLTRGGSHAGEELEPNFSWSEGQATGFGCLLRATPAYVDTYGTSGGGVFISQSAENWSQSVRGIGGEETVAELVWDLGDGGGGPNDTDGDVAALPLGQLLSAFFGFSTSSDAPYIGLFLDRLRGAGSISTADLGTLMVTPENQQIAYPLVGDDVWPIPLAVPGAATGTCDATTGNRCRGLDASRWYGFTLGATQTLTFDLSIQDISGSGNDLNLYLLRASGTTLDSSFNGTSSPERIGPIALQSGTYLVRVEASCLGAGSKADYTLTVGP